jgi:uncharacterized protein (AIM24 family)
MSFQYVADMGLNHQADDERPAYLSFSVSGRQAQQLAIKLKPGMRVVGWASSIVAYDRNIHFEDAGNPALLMAANLTDESLQLVFSPGGPVGAFMLGDNAGRMLLPQESFLAAGPGVSLKPYTHFRNLTSPSRPTGLVLLQADGDGWVFTGAAGEVSELRLSAGETLAVRPCAIAAMTSTIIIDQAETKVGNGGNKCLRSALLRGPGRIWLQKADGSSPVVERLPCQTMLFSRNLANGVSVSEDNKPVLQ